MSKMTGILMLAVVIALLAGSANATDMVNTTFEEGSPNAGDWKIATSNVWDEPDPASGINWARFSNSSIISTGGYGGGQCGRITSANKGAYLTFGSGSNDDVYTATYYHKVTANGTSDDTMMTSFSQNLWNIFAQVDARITLENPGTSSTIDHFDIVAVDNSGDTTVLTNCSADTWYEVKVVIDVPNKKFDVSAREAGGTWSTTQTGLDFSYAATSFDTVMCRSNGSGPYEYWDDIKVVPEPATMTLLLLGLPFALRRRK